jgi:cytochrome c-type biogenesis protein
VPGSDIATLILWPIGFGLLGFIEPCAIGATLLFVKTTEGQPPAVKVAQVFAFTLSRALFIGLLGALAAFIGTMFLAVQKAVWLLMGALYVAIGVLYLTGRIGALMVSIGPRLASLASPRGSIVLGVTFGLNIPACAGPILIALLAASAAGGASGETVARGFASLALFGFALSLPLVAAVLFVRAHRVLDWLGGLTRRMPLWTGVLFVVLGAWSIWFGLFVSIE